MPDIKITSIKKAKSIIKEERTEGKKHRKKSLVIMEYEGYIQKLERGKAIGITLKEDDKFLTIKYRLNTAAKSLGIKNLKIERAGNKVVIYREVKHHGIKTDENKIEMLTPNEPVDEHRLEPAQPVSESSASQPSSTIPVSSDAAPERFPLLIPLPYDQPASLLSAESGNPQETAPVTPSMEELTAPALASTSGSPDIDQEILQDMISDSAANLAPESTAPELTTTPVSTVSDEVKPEEPLPTPSIAAADELKTPELTIRHVPPATDEIKPQEHVPASAITPIHELKTREPETAATALSPGTSKEQDFELDEELEVPMIYGQKTCEASMDKYTGSTFRAFGHQFFITKVEQLPLGEIAEKWFAQHGFFNAREFREVWKQHHKGSFDPQEGVWLHHFQRGFPPPPEQNTELPAS